MIGIPVSTVLGAPLAGLLLQMNGLQGTRITGEGRGAREPVVANCSRVVSPTSVLCNQPNRRVVVEITGARRQ